jgi:protein-disulfide isomerase
MSNSKRATFVWAGLLAGLILVLLCACMVDGEATRKAAAEHEEADSRVQHEAVHEEEIVPTDTTAPKEEVAPTDTTAPKTEAKDERVIAGARVVSDPTPVVIDDITLPTPAYFEQESVAALGDPDAPIKIVEFSDFQCPYCARFAVDAWPQIRQTFVESGRVYWVFKDYPLDQIHPYARLAAQAAHCAGEQLAYWEMHDELFEQQAGWTESSSPGDDFKEIAGQLGLDQGAFGECLDSGRHATTVTNNVTEGQAAGMSGTPTFFFNGYPASGAIPFEGFEQIVSIIERGELEQNIADSIRQSQATPTPRPIVDVPVGDAPVKGAADAPVTIVEFSDYQCPYCGRYVVETMPRIMAEYVETGQVRYAFKDFPLSFHAQARQAAQAARCAGEQDAYWEMHDKIFGSQESWSGNNEAVAVFVEWAAGFGLDQDAFSECLESERHAAGVEADFQEGVSFGVTGTPAFFVNGQLISGAQPFEVFQSVIEAALQQ